jgi:hypothetical protein
MYMYVLGLWLLQSSETEPEEPHLRGFGDSSTVQLQ